MVGRGGSGISVFDGVFFLFLILSTLICGSTVWLYKKDRCGISRKLLRYDYTEHPFSSF